MKLYLRECRRIAISLVYFLFPESVNLTSN